MTKLDLYICAIQGWDGFSVKHDLEEYGGGGYAVGGQVRRDLKSKQRRPVLELLCLHNHALMLLRDMTRGKGATETHRRMG